jgi:hypothetical protein
MLALYSGNWFPQMWQASWWNAVIATASDACIFGSNSEETADPVGTKNDVLA